MKLTKLMKCMLRSLMLTLLFFLPVVQAAGQGLAFYGQPRKIDKRTSFDVFHYHQPVFRGRLIVKFKLRLPEESCIGYVFRIVDSNDGSIYNLYLDSGRGVQFALNREAERQLVSLVYDSRRSHRGRWVDVAVELNSDKGYATLQVDKIKRVGWRLNASRQMRPKLVFGRSDYIIDVPPVVVRDLQVSDGRDVNYMFPLNQSEGNDVYDTRSYKMGYVENPYWSIRDNYYWKRIATVGAASNAGATYLPDRRQILFYSRDSIKFIDVATGVADVRPYASPMPLRVETGRNFMRRGRLYAYEVLGGDGDQCSVASLDLGTLRWQSESDRFLPMQLHHHTGFFPTADSSRYYIYGGFGSERFWNNFYAYDFATRAWHRADGLRGPHPYRYFVSSGGDGRRYTYIFGGMGNAIGDQTLGRRYYYDLYRLDPKRREIKKLWARPKLGGLNMVPASSLIVKGNHFYALCYSEYFSKTWLKLYRIALKDGTAVQVGDSIPIVSDRIETNSNLFFDQQLQRFIVTVVQYSVGPSPKLNIYTINAPVKDTVGFRSTREHKVDTYMVNLSASIALVVLFVSSLIIVWLYYHRKRKMEQQPGEEPLDPLRPNSVYLFGEFSAFDREGRDVAYLFTDKQRLLFCLLLQFDDRGGISSHTLGNVLWGDKPDDKIKNSRSVAISRLRKTLEDFDGVGVVFENGKFRLDHQEAFYCDYLDVRQRLHDESDDVKALLAKLRRGKFLFMIDSPVMDKFKHETEQLLMPYLKRALRQLAQQEDYWHVVTVSDSIFEIDPLDEEALEQKVKALRRLNREDEAVDAQRHFRKLRRQMMGE